MKRVEGIEVFRWDGVVNHGSLLNDDVYHYFFLTFIIIIIFLLGAGVLGA